MAASTLDLPDDGGLSFRLFGFPVRVRWGFFGQERRAAMLAAGRDAHAPTGYGGAT